MLEGKVLFILVMKPEARLVSERMNFFFYSLIGLFLRIWFVSMAAQTNSCLDCGPEFSLQTTASVASWIGMSLIRAGTGMAER